MFKLVAQFISLCRLNLSGAEILKQTDDKVVGRMVRVARGVRGIRASGSLPEGIKTQKIRNSSDAAAGCANFASADLRNPEEVNLTDEKSIMSLISFIRRQTRDTLAKEEKHKERERKKERKRKNENRKCNGPRYDQSSGE